MSIARLLLLVTTPTLFACGADLASTGAAPASAEAKGDGGGFPGGGGPGGGDGGFPGGGGPGGGDGGFPGGGGPGGGDGGFPGGGGPGGGFPGGGDGGDGGDTGPVDTGGDTDVVLEPVDYCHLQWPCEMSAAAESVSNNVYCWIYEYGVTEGEGEGEGLIVEVGVGADGSDPGAGDWGWQGMDYVEDVYVGGSPSNDLYEGAFGTGAAGSYDYACRVSADDGASWTYCDAGDDGASDGCGDGLSGSADGYSPEHAGQLTVE